MSTGVPQPIRQVIGRFRLRLRLLRATVGLGVTLLVWSLVLGTALGLDRWLVLPVIWRTMITAGAVTIGLVAAIVLILVPVLRPLRRLALARTIESAAPALEEGLLTVCELAALPPAQSDSPELVAALQSDTVDRVRALSVGDLVDSTPARRALTVGVTAALVLVVIALLEPTGFRQLLERFARPADASLPRPTTVVIDVRPGGIVIGKGARVEVTAAPVQGRPGVAFIWWRFPGGDWHREMMRETSTRSPVEGGSIFRYVLRDVERDFEYRVRGGDFLSPVHLVQVRERPAPTGFRMTYRYPDYTGKAPETVPAELGNVAAVVGTEVDVEVQVDRDLVRASIRIEGEDVEPRDVEVVGASCRFHVTLRKTTRYHLLLEDPEGVTSVAGGPFSLEAMQDRPPLLRIIRPRATRTAVEPGRSLGVHVEARDDFGVESITIAAARPDGAPQSFTIPLDVEDRTAFAVKYRWDVSRLGLGPGESARFRIVVRDGSGTVTRGPPSSVEVAFLPDPPEGGEWFSRLDEIQREFKHAMEEWSHLLGGTGDPSARLMVADRARAELLGEVSGETLRHLDQWRQLAGRCDATGDAVAIPSIHRRGLAALADRLRECARSEGMTFWRATLDTAAAMKRTVEGGAGVETPPAATPGDETTEEGGPAVDARTLRVAFAAARDRLLFLAKCFTTMHRGERVEEVVDRHGALRDLQADILERVGRGKTAALLQRTIRHEARTLGAELLDAARLGGDVDRRLETVAEFYVDLTMPRLENLLRSMEGGGERSDERILLQMEEALKTLHMQARTFAGELERQELLVDGAWGALEAPKRVEELLEMENAASAPIMEAAVAALRSEARFARRLRPPDYESAIDLSKLLGILEHERKAAVMGPATVSGESRGMAAFLHEFARACRGVRPGVVLGMTARSLEGVAGAQDAIAWNLRSMTAGRGLALRVLARAENELLRVIRHASKDIRELGAEFSWRADDVARAAALVESSVEPARRGSVAARDQRPRDALTAAQESASRTREAVALLDDVRAGPWPELDAARMWIASRIGGLAERVLRLARREQEIASRLEARPAGAAIAALLTDQEENSHETVAVAGAFALEANRTSMASPTETNRARCRELDTAVERLTEIAEGEMVDVSRWLESASHAAAGEDQGRILVESARFARAAAAALVAIAERLRLVERVEILQSAGGELGELVGGDDDRDWSDPATLELLVKKARTYLAAVRRALEKLSGDLDAGASWDQLVNILERAAVKFQEALSRATEGKGELGSQRLTEGRGLLDSAVALVRRLRGETERSLDSGQQQAGQSKDAGKRSREFEEVQARLRKIQELRGWQKQLEAQLDELFRDPLTTSPEQLSELARLQQRLAEVFGDQMVTGEKLLEMVADLVKATREIAAVEKAQREIGDAALRGEAIAALAVEQAKLIEVAQEITDRLVVLGGKLSMNVSAVLEPFWKAQERAEPAIEAMIRAGGALREGRLVSASEESGRAVAEFRTMGELLDVARDRALEEIADRAAGGARLSMEAEADSGGMERTLDSLQQAAQELSRGNVQSARAFQQSASRGMLSGVGSLRAYLERLRQNPGDEGALLSRILDRAEASRAGLSWAVRTRSSERDPAIETEEPGDRGSLISDFFPEEYRELVRIYFKALAGQR